jgi:hypothetical protein
MVKKNLALTKLACSGTFVSCELITPLLILVLLLVLMLESFLTILQVRRNDDWRVLSGKGLLLGGMRISPKPYVRVRLV